VTAQPVARRWAGLILLLTLGAVVWGTLSLFALPSGIYPDVEFPRLVVVAHAGDLPPEVMQTAATGPLEQALATVPGVRRLNARTIRGATELNAQFAPGTDMWRALQLAQTQVAEIRSELPEGTELTVERVTPTALPIVTFNVSGSSDPRELYEVAARTIRPALTRVPGVGSVDVQGGLVREVEVVMKPAALAAAHLTPSGLADRVSQVVTLAAAGRALDEHQVLTVMAGVEPSSPEALAALPVDGVPLAAVADVFDGSEDRTTTVTGPAGDAVVITVSRAEGASAPDVVAGAQQVLAGLARDHVLPAGVKVETVYDQAVLIEDALHGVRDAILLGVALSLVVLAVFLRDARAGAAAAVAVPVTLLATFGVMRLFGQTLNLMSMGGLAVAIGLVVDDAIVIVEAIVRRQEEGLGVSEAAARGTRDLFAAVVGTTATTVVVFAPLALIAGVVGAFFGALAVTLSIAVVLSLVFAVTLVPLVATALLRPRAPAERPGGALAAAYGRVLRRVVRHPVLSVVAVVAAAVVGVLAARATPTGFLPAMDEGAVVVDFFLPAGTSLDETDRIARRIDAVLAARPYVATFTRRTGTEMGPATATVQNRGDILVRLVPRDRRPSVYAVMDDLRGRLAEAAPEARVELVQVLQDVLNDLAGNPNPIEVKVFGRDPAELDRIAPEIAAKLEGLDALEDLFNGVEGRVPELRADVDVAAADRLKVTPAQVTEDLRVSLAGRVAARSRRRRWRASRSRSARRS
jgi:multidrug efflux pump subunit AcrB